MKYKNFYFFVIYLNWLLKIQIQQSVSKYLFLFHHGVKFGTRSILYRVPHLCGPGQKLPNHCDLCYEGVTQQSPLTVQ